MIRSDRFAFVFCFQHTRLFLPHPTCFVFNMHVLSHVLSFSASYIHVLFSTYMDSCFLSNVLCYQHARHYSLLNTCFVFNMHVLFVSLLLHSCLVFNIHGFLLSIGRALLSTCTSLFSIPLHGYCKLLTTRWRIFAEEFGHEITHRRRGTRQDRSQDVRVLSLRHYPPRINTVL